MIAGVASGLIAPRLAEKMLGTQGPDAAVWRMVFSYNGYVNQGFATVYVVASGVAIVLWSAGVIRRRTMPSALGTYGVIAGVLMIIGVASGHVRLNVHGFGAIVVLQAIFFVTAAVNLIRKTEARPSGV
jgi:hypothetical protein